jgi:hypothetical protein
VALGAPRSLENFLRRISQLKRDKNIASPSMNHALHPREVGRGVYEIIAESVDRGIHGLYDRLGGATR